MGTTGTVVNGRIELDDPQFFAEGTKVWIDHDVTERNESYEEHLANLRQSIADGEAGLGIPLKEAMAILREEIEGMPISERDR
jgi:hypothetical protein